MAKTAPAKKTVKAPAKTTKTTAKTIKQAAKTPAKPAKTVSKASVKQAAKPVVKSVVKQQPANTVKTPVKAAAPAPANKEMADFAIGDFVVYPTHGVGTIEAVETATIGGMQVSMYKIMFKQDRMVLRVPVQTARAKGLRKLVSNDRLAEAMNTLKGRAKIKRTMWSRRAQEYESKINSGDPVAIAEVLRDLKRSNDDTEQSFSERQIYQSALSRLAREVAAVEKLTEMDAATKLEGLMGKIKKSAANDQAVAA